MTKVLIITGDPIGAKRAGPAMRAWHMAEALAAANEVTLVSLTSVEPVEAPFRVLVVRPGHDRSFRPLEEWADVVVFQGHAMWVFGRLRSTKKVVVVDIYDPMHLEQLEQSRGLSRAERARRVSDATSILNEQLLRGDFFMCASERQRLFWLGQLAGLGRVNPDTYENDPHLKRLISVVPFGLEAEAPRHEHSVLKGVHPQIAKTDKLLLWGGGLYDWFDPRTLIRAVAALGERRPNVRLFFQGTRHPNPDVPEMAIVEESRKLARELGVLDKTVFFHDSWVDFAERQNYLTEADAGVSTHLSNVETTFSFRTRILDYLWATLPMVVTEGDHFADLVASERLGLVVEAGNVELLADALEKVLFDAEFAATCRENIRRVRPAYEWPTVLVPLVRFVASASRAPDSNRRAVGEVVHRAGLRRDIAVATRYLRNGGPRVVLDKVKSRLARHRR